MRVYVLPYLYELTGTGGIGLGPDMALGAKPTTFKPSRKWRKPKLKKPRFEQDESSVRVRLPRRKS